MNHLRRGGWLDDPSDNVTVQPEHREDCTATAGGACNCTPRLVMRLEAPRPVWSRPTLKPAVSVVPLAASL